MAHHIVTLPGDGIGPEIMAPTLALLTTLGDFEFEEHPYWVATQAHPEFKSRPDRAHPLFRELVAAALERAEGREPHLLDLDSVS